MKNIINKVIGKITGKSRKFFPAVDENRRFEIVEKPRKFFPMTEKEYLLAQRRKGIIGNGECDIDKF